MRLTGNAGFLYFPVAFVCFRRQPVRLIPKEGAK